MKHNLVESYRSIFKHPIHPKHRCADDEYVYLLVNPLNRLSKIGITKNPKVRHRAISASAGTKCYMVLLLELEPGYDENGYIIEQFIHNHYRSQRTHGEWFMLNVKNMIEIRNLFYEVGGEQLTDRLKQSLLAIQKDQVVYSRQLSAIHQSV